MSSREILIWFLAAVFVKGAYLLWLGEPPRLTGDAIVYVESIETLFTEGTYAWDLSRPETYAARMPGMLLPYGILRLFFDPGDSRALQQCFQALLDAAAVLALLLLASQLGVRLAVARVTTLLYLVSTGVSSWNGLLVTESLATSGSLIGIWLCVWGAQTRSQRLLGLGALFLAWVGFLKAFYFGWVAAIAVALSWAELRRSGGGARKAAQMILTVSMPFMLFVVIWAIRNERLTGRLVLLQDGINGGYAYPSDFAPLRSFMQAVGGDFVSWNPKAEVRWFDPWAGQIRPKDAPFPPDEIDAGKRFATQACAYERLLEVRSAYRVARTATEDSLRLAAADVAAKGLVECREAFIRERAWEYRVVAPLRLLASYLSHSGTYNLFPRPFSALSLGEKAFKLVQSALHLGTVVLGLSGALFVLLLRPGSHPFALPVAVAALGHAIGFPVILRLAEYRYLVMAYPLLFLCAAILVSSLTPRMGAPRESSAPSSGRSPQAT